MTARRPLLTAAAAGALCSPCGSYRPPLPAAEADGATDSGLRTASATAGSGLDPPGGQRGPGHRQRSTTTTPHHSGTGAASGADGASAGTPAHFLADTGSPDTTPYVIGGAACLALGAGLVSYSVRRTRDETPPEAGRDDGRPASPGGLRQLRPVTDSTAATSFPPRTNASAAARSGARKRSAPGPWTPAARTASSTARVAGAGRQPLAQLDGAGRRVQLDGDDPGQVVDRGAQLARRRPAHRDVVLLHRGGRDRVRRGRARRAASSR